MLYEYLLFFMIVHTWSFFKNSKANRILGIITGIITHFPFEKWKHDHIIHHATSGNLDKRGTGDIWVMTVEEYSTASFWRKAAYRLYRNPLVMFGLGPFYLFLLDNRINRKGAKWKERWNTYFTNVCIVVIYALIIWGLGWKVLLMVQFPIMFVAGAVGIWLFYIQHQFEESYYEHDDQWDYVRAAVDGSSYYQLPKILQWFTGNIGFHHVHHLSPRVPNYQLEKAHHAVLPLQKVATISLMSSLQSIRFRLFDESTRSFISFKQYKIIQKQQKRQKQNISKHQHEQKQSKLARKIIDNPSP